MDRLFLDANVLFSGAYRPGAGLLDFRKLKDVTLCSSRYALEEARVNLLEPAQRERLETLSEKLQFFDPPTGNLPPGIFLPGKDAPILLAAVAPRATHLVTGDIRHFGDYFEKKINGILITLPATCLDKHRRKQ